VPPAPGGDTDHEHGAHTTSEHTFVAFFKRKRRGAAVGEGAFCSVIVKLLSFS
jgi:hypothetical protein